MPGYFYHLTFELYPVPDPTATEQRANAIPLPPTDANIFTHDFPAHAASLPNTVTPSDDWRISDSHTAPVSGPSQDRKSAADSVNQQRKPILNVIDCGSARKATSATANPSFSYAYTDGGEIVSRPNPTKSHPAQAVRDWRFGPIQLESIDMNPPPAIEQRQHGEGVGTSRPAYGRGGSSWLSSSTVARVATTTTFAAPEDAASGINAGPRSRETKARFEPLAVGHGDHKVSQLGWGIVHLYRDGEETPDIDASSVRDDLDPAEDCTTLCIPAVPSYLTPQDFLGFVGEETREQVSHFRMVMTGKMNRYLVLMKFRDSKVAKQWRREWDGKVFNNIGPENCHVMFIKSIVFQVPRDGGHTSTFPDPAVDPFTPAATTSIKPFPPPTPNLVELPTCPVCLERMDDTTGLLTILCQHVFHCACLQKWKGSGCPVCRHTQRPVNGASFGANPGGESLCTVCNCTDDLWICLICGNVGCGRYKGGHAKRHWQETAHNFSLEIETQHVWDYAGDVWVHRLIQSKGDGKLVELPSRSRQTDGESTDLDMVPRQKLENIGAEYTHMLSSQLESQRLYYEEIVSKAADKASEAAAAADAAQAKADAALAQLRELREENRRLQHDVIPELDKERSRAVTKADKSSELARNMTKSFQEEKEVGKGLMQRVEHVNQSMAELAKQLAALRAENADLQEQNRDLSFFISGQQKLQEMAAETSAGAGEVGRDEIEQGTVSLPQAPSESRKSRKGKGRGR